MQIMDAVLADLLENTIGKIFPKTSRPALCYHGGSEPKTQPLDIAHAMQLLVERGMDSMAEMAVAQQDIKAYYDNIDIMKVVEFILQEDRSDAAKAICKSLLNMRTKRR